MNLFKTLVKSVLFYGVEVWGYKEWEGIERIKKIYMKWVLGLDRGTPDSILRRETKQNKLWAEAVFRVFKYEEKLSRLECDDIRKEIYMKKVNEIGILNKYDKERKAAWEKLGLKYAEEMESGEMKNDSKWRAMERANEQVKKEDLKKLRETRYAESLRNLMYEEWEKNEIPGYIAEGKNISKIARFRTGNEFKGCKFWKNEWERRCRLCGEEPESAEHIFEKCKSNRRKTECRIALKEDGSGLGFLMGVEWLRKRKIEEG